MFKFVLIAALVASALAADIPFDTCDGLPSPTSLNIPECSASPCDLHVGDQFTLNFNILTTGPVASLPTVVTITQGGTETSFPLPTGDACFAVSTGSCPLAAGEHTISFPVTLAGVPSGESTVRVEITDEAGNAVACGSVTTTIGA